MPLRSRHYGKKSTQTVFLGVRKVKYRTRRGKNFHENLAFPDSDPITVMRWPQWNFFFIHYVQPILSGSLGFIRTRYKIVPDHTRCLGTIGSIVSFIESHLNVISTIVSRSRLGLLGSLKGCARTKGATSWIQAFSVCDSVISQYAWSFFPSTCCPCSLSCSFIWNCTGICVSFSLSLT